MRAACRRASRWHEGSSGPLHASRAERWRDTESRLPLSPTQLPLEAAEVVINYHCLVAKLLVGGCARREAGRSRMDPPRTDGMLVLTEERPLYS